MLTEQRKKELLEMAKREGWQRKRPLTEQRKKELLEMAKREGWTRKKPSFFEGVTSDIKERGKKAGEYFMKSARGQLNPGAAAVGVVAQPFKAAGDIFGRAVAPVVEPILSPIVRSQKGLHLWEKPIQAYGNIKQAFPRTIDFAENVGSIGAGFSGAVGTGKTVGKTIGRVASKTNELTRTGFKTGEELARKGKELARTGLKKGEELTRTGLKKREINKNIAKEKESLLKSVGEKGRRSVNLGVELDDVVKINKILNKKPKGNKTRSIMQEMTRKAKNFDEFDLKTDPRTTIGSVAVKQFQQLDDLRRLKGKELEKTAIRLKGKQVEDATENILEAMEKTPGLEGIKLIDNTLDFSETRLSSVLSKKDVSLIQKTFDDLSQNKDAFTLHKKRQGLLDQIGGRKRTLDITDTQENALNAMRSGIAKSLDKLDTTYRKINMEYGQIAEPLSLSRKWFNSLGGASQDLLEMKAATMARRLTSNAVSRFEIQNALEKMYDVLRKYEKYDGIDLTELQAYYNMLQKYYEFQPGTSFGSLVRVNTRIPTSKSNLLSTIIQKGEELVSKPFQESVDTRRKGLEDYIFDVNPKQAIPKKKSSH